MTNFEEHLLEGVNALLVEDGEWVEWTPPFGGQSRQVRVTHTRQSVQVDVGGVTSLFNHTVVVRNQDIDPDTAQGGVMILRGKTYYIAEPPNVMNEVVSTFLLSESPIHGTQDPSIAQPVPLTVTYRGDMITYQGEEVTYAGTV